MVSPRQVLRFLFALVCLLAGPLGGAQERSPREVLAAVDQHYNRLRAFSADFAEEYHAAGIARTESGRLWLKRPGRMRWEYRQPREKLFVSDGKTAYFYVPGDQQARRAPVKKLDDLRSPLRFLLGKASLEKELDSVAMTASGGNVVLRGRPKSLADRVQELVLEVSPESRILRIVIHEVDGSTTEFRFSHILENPPVEEAQFRFSPPPGVQVVDTAEVAP